MKETTTTDRRAACNTGLTKVAVQCSADTFVVKIATFAKPETFSGNFTDTFNMGNSTSLTNQEKKLFLALQHLIFKVQQILIKVVNAVGISNILHIHRNALPFHNNAEFQCYYFVQGY